MAASMPKTITAKALLALRTKFVPVDATWYLPNVGRDGYKEYEEARMPGAVYFNVDAIKSESPYPHMMPTQRQFDAAMSRLGLSPDDLLVVYDKQSFFAAPRAAWMLETYFHHKSLLLDNWADYRALGGPIESGPPAPRAPTEYRSPGYTDWVQFEHVHALARAGLRGGAGETVVIDARPANRFTGAAPEPRPEVPSGHIPGSISLPFTDVLEDGHFKSRDAVAALLAERGVAPSARVIAMCGSGVSACVLKDAIDQVLDHPAQVYDGSWSEFAVRAPEFVEVSK